MKGAGEEKSKGAMEGYDSSRFDVTASSIDWAGVVNKDVKRCGFALSSACRPTAVVHEVDVDVRYAVGDR